MIRYGEKHPFLCDQLRSASPFSGPPHRSRPVPVGRDAPAIRPAHRAVPAHRIQARGHRGVRAIGLHIEEIPDVAEFSAAVRKAVGAGIPVVALRTGVSEIGVRLALGATPSRIRRAILAEGATLTALGLSFGVGAAFGVAVGLSIALGA